MSFLGFSFADLNIGVLLRLARAYGTAEGDRQLAVMRRPADPVKARGRPDFR